eukprot:scaffold83751_cov60-Phaeocystis_antarctica.AAC.1
MLQSNLRARLQTTQEASTSAAASAATSPSPSAAGPAVAAPAVDGAMPSSAAEAEEAAEAAAAGAAARAACEESAATPAAVLRGKYLTRKLREISELKKLLVDGKTLDQTQLEMIETEDTLRAELATLKSKLRAELATLQRAELALAAELASEAAEAAEAAEFFGSFRAAFGVAAGTVWEESADWVQNKICSIGKKLRQIVELKELLAGGRTLEAGQLNKIKGEGSVRAELARLQA